MSAMQDRETSLEQGVDEPRIGWQWPDWVVLAALGLLVITTAFLAVYTTSLRSRINALRMERVLVTTPANRAAQELAVALSLELDAIYEYALDADPDVLVDYRESAVARREAMARMEVLAPRLDSTSELYSQDLVRLTRLWEGAALDPVSLAALTAEVREQHLGEVRVLYRQILLGATAQQESLRAAFEETRAEIEQAELLIWSLSLGLATVVLAASLLVLWLFRRSRRLQYVAERRRLQAEAAMERRARLIRGITHDVKNPLSNADGNAQLLELGIVGGLTEAQQDSVAGIRRGIGASLRIISDLLELARAEAEQLDIKISPTDVGAILAQAAADYRLEAEAKGLALELEPAPGLPRIRTDGDRVREIIANLLSNAIKYTPSGGRLTLDANVPSAEHGRLRGSWITVSVADTGPGISPDETEAIFEEFYRARSLPGRPAGLGLGLSVSRKIARLLGGDITVQSQPGEGSVFTLWLPREHEAHDRRIA